PRLTFRGSSETLPDAAGVAAEPPAAPVPLTPAAVTGEARVELLGLAWDGSGGKGRLCNVAVIARRAEYLPWLRAALTPQAVGEWYRHLGRDGQPPSGGRYDGPGGHAGNL